MVSNRIVSPRVQPVQAMQYAYIFLSFFRFFHMKRLLLVLSFLLLMAIPGRGQIVAVQTNLLDYAALGTLNLQAQISFAQHFSAFVDGRINPWQFGQAENPVKLKHKKVSAGLRFWPWYVYSGWWFAASVQWSDFDRHNIFKTPNVLASKGFGGGLSAGYSFMLHKNLNLDVGAGICYTRYQSYVVNNIPDNKGTQSFFQPDFLSVSLVYVFR